MQSISNDYLSHRLSHDNPWWDYSSEIETKTLTMPKRDLFPAFAQSIRDLGQDDTLVLAGCLGVGKTVMVHQAIAGLIEDGAPSSTILYCALSSPVYGGVDINRLLEMFTARQRHDPDTPIFIFFDEIQYTGDWQEKFAALGRSWPKAYLIAAVSSGAPAINTGASCFILPPLTFPEYLRFKGVEKTFFAEGQTGSALVLKPGAIRALNEEFHEYVNSGDFPEQNKIEGLLNTDLASLHGISNTQELNRLLAILATNTGREVSFEDLTNALGVAKNTLRKYLDYLERAFLIRRLTRVDQSANRFKRAVAFKVYLTTPCLYAALFGPVDAQADIFPRLTETALVSQWLGAEAAATLGYASWRGGAIDLLALDPVNDRPSHVYELDWPDDYAPDGKKAGTGPRELSAFVSGTNKDAKAFVLTRENTRQGTIGGVDVTLVPLSLYAYWLARDPTLGGFHGEV